MIRSVALVALLTLAAPSAAAAQQAPDMKALIERQRKCLKAISAHLSKVSFDEKDVEAFLANWRSFDALDLDDEAEDDAGPECVDLPAALADPGYVAWARQHRVDPKTWLPKSLRITLTYVKRRTPAQMAEMKAQMAAQRAELEKSCKSMGPNACQEVAKAYANSDELMKESMATVALFPEPTRAEAALLERHGARIQAAVEEDARGDRDEPGSAADEEEGEDEK